MADSKTRNFGPIPGGTAADTGVGPGTNVGPAGDLRGPASNRGTHPDPSQRVKLTGPLGAELPPQRPAYGEGSPDSSFPRFEGDTPAYRDAFTKKARRLTRPSPPPASGGRGAASDNA